MTPVRLALATSIALFLLACDSSGGPDGSKSTKFDLSDRGLIELDYGSTVFAKGEVAPGKVARKTVVVRNLADKGALAVSLRFEYDDPGVTEESPAMWLDASLKAFAVAPGGSVELIVNFRRDTDGAPRRARLHVDSDTVDAEKRELVVEFTTQEGIPVAKLGADSIDFGQVGIGQVAKKPVQLFNTGSDRLELTSILLLGHPDFLLTHPEGVMETGETLNFDPPLVVEMGTSVVFQMQFEPLTGTPADAKLVLYTSDPMHPSGLTVDCAANSGSAAIAVNPKKMQFGGKLVGKKAVLPLEIHSIGVAPLEVTGLYLKEGSSPRFILTDDLELPLVVPVNGVVSVSVEYVPSVENPPGPDGQPIFDTGFIVIESNAWDSEVEIEVTGLGVEKGGPSAIGVIQEGEQVIPQTNLHLFGDQSFAPGSSIASWKWSVLQPTGSASFFVPSDTFPNPQFQANVAGEYAFSLDVWDGSGIKSYVPWVGKVLVVPDEAIHVELIWTTPNDPDETDEGPEAGTDLDLHFVHDAYAYSMPDQDGDGVPDPWFMQPFDTFWYNEEPNWGSFDPSIDDNPSLDRDDTDGAGPENLNLNTPENTTYRIGVHYWSDNAYGPSYATVRVYIYSNLVFEVVDQKLENLDLWDVATIEWPSGKVSLVKSGAGTSQITKGYEPPIIE